MTDRTHPDSGRATGGIVEMLQDRVAELEAQLESIGAGGVNGPLMGQSFDAADMATASAQGFRDGVASLAASAGSEPVAYAMFADNGNIRLWSKARIPHPDAKPLYFHPSPPEGMVGGRLPTFDMRAVVAVAVTMLYETHPEDVRRVFDLRELEKIVGITGPLGSQQVEDIYRSAWDHLDAPPTTPAGSGKGE